MAIYTTLNELFTGIANAIRTKNNTTELIMASNFPAEIASLRMGFDYNNQNTTSIADYQFYECEDLKSLDCPNLTSVGTGAFENCTNLKSVILYDGVESVEENAFKGCNNLTIYCEAAEKPETWHENWNPDNCEVVWEFNLVETWDVSATEEDNVTAKLYNDALNEGMYSLVVSGNGDMKDCALYSDVPWVDCRKNINSVTISKGITSIGDFAFCVTKLTSITIPNTVTSIGDNAFSSCTDLTSINIPNGVTNIGNKAFRDCTSLTSITIPNSVTSIKTYAFSGCTSLTSITIPNSVTSIGEFAFSVCTSLTSIAVPDSVTSINYNVFYGCTGLKTAGPIGGGYNYEFGWTDRIEDNAFEGCSALTTITIPDTVTSIGTSAFQGCKSLISINIPNSVTSIGSCAFFKCTSLTSITIPDGVTSIARQTFQDCTSLTSINIPKSVTSIGGWVFEGCSSLTSINYSGTISQWQSITFGNDWNEYTGNYTIHCTDGDIAKDGTILGGAQ